MTLREKIVADLAAAMKAREAARLGVLRMLKARILEAEVELRTSRGMDYRLDDAETTGVLAAYAKQRRDSIEAYRRAGREDLASREEGELAIIQEYLPRPLGEEEIRALVREAIAAAGAGSPREMGAVMKLVMPKVRGAADGKRINEIVKEMLSGG